MAYISTMTWRDLTDSHLYHEGDPFPFDGREIPEDRLEFLAGTQNKVGSAVIELVPEAVEEIPAEEPEAPKRRRKAAKKAE